MRSAELILEEIIRGREEGILRAAREVFCPGGRRASWLKTGDEAMPRRQVRSLMNIARDAPSPEIIYAYIYYQSTKHTIWKKIAKTTCKALGRQIKEVAEEAKNKLGGDWTKYKAELKMRVANIFFGYLDWAYAIATDEEASRYWCPPQGGERSA